MKKQRNAVSSILLLICLILGGCSGNSEEPQAAAFEDASGVEASSEAERKTEQETEGQETGAEEQEAELPDGVYTAEFDTDNAMFRANETCDGKGVLTVENGEMTLHVSLASKNIVNLYPGLAEDAKKDGAVLLEPTEDEVTYSDGWTEAVYGFDIPVPMLEEEFDLALVGKKGTWYDHKVIVSNPEPLIKNFGDGSYTVDLTLEGGSGKSEILSPAVLTAEGGTVTAEIRWDSPNYDYMIVDGEKYLPVNTEGNSVFKIPVLYFDVPMDIVGDTVAMSKPHEIEYTLTFHLNTVKPEE